MATGTPPRPRHQRLLAWAGGVLAAAVLAATALAWFNPHLALSLGNSLMGCF